MPPEAIAIIEELQSENKRLGLPVKALEKELYGSRSDRRPPVDENQTTFSEIDGVSEPEPAAASPKSSSRRKERKGVKKGPKPINPDFPRVDERIADPDLKELICPVTGLPMKPVFEEKVEVLARKLNPARLLELRRRFSLPAVDALLAKALAYAQSERMLKTS
ncbi:MAG: hypothetical protein GVY36_18650 [Verrucomicrobia bacterium]|jgi:hypothetical protein|nr:hypothetical protein [Verrucomicrobiota bacterium]